jgi:hypothetical protein
MPPSNQFEVVLFWIVGIVITIFGGGIMIYANYFHFLD